MKVYVPCDSSAVSVGADAVARAIAQHAITKQGPDVTVVRNGSRGMFWLEPLVEVETPKGRVAYGPVTADAVEGLLAAGMLEGKPHPLCQGLTEEIPFFKKQERLTFARCGITDPLSLADYVSHGGFKGLQRAKSLAPDAVIEEVVAVSAAAGVNLDLAQSIQICEKIAEAMPKQLSSTAQDIARKKRSEIDHLNGFVVREGQRLSVATPVNQTLHALVKLIESEFSEV